MGDSTGAAVIFGATGGVMEAALRTAYEIVTGREVPFGNLNITPVRGMDGVKEATIKIEGCVEAWKFLEGVPFFLREGPHIIIESRDGHTPVPVVELRDDLRKRLDRVVHGAAERPGMEILVRPHHLHLHITEPAQPVTDRRNVFAEH